MYEENHRNPQILTELLAIEVVLFPWKAWLTESRGDKTDAGNNFELSKCNNVCLPVSNLQVTFCLEIGVVSGALRWKFLMVYFENSVVLSNAPTLYSGLTATVFNIWRMKGIWFMHYMYSYFFVTDQMSDEVSFEAIKMT